MLKPKLVFLLVYFIYLIECEGTYLLVKLNNKSNEVTDTKIPPKVKGHINFLE